MSRRTGLALFSLLLPALLPAADAKLDFNRDVRPILSDKCFQCHGPDDKTLKGDVRLDDRNSAVSAKAIVPGSPELSEALARILSDDPDEVMPPPKTKKTVSPAEAEILRRWIAEGAEYKGHWAFEPIAATETGDGQHPVDQFVRAELQRKGIQPSPEADPATLIRRLSLDLTGLLPAPDRVGSFLTEHQSNPDQAVAKLADELLASPHYGERWGRHWLDQARYADSNGYSIDGDRSPVALSRLGHPRDQRRPALRPLHDRADRRGPPAEREQSPARRLGLSSKHPHQPGRRHRSRAVPQ
jgi:hypothetical protein